MASKAVKLVNIGLDMQRYILEKHPFTVLVSCSLLSLLSSDDRITHALLGNLVDVWNMSRKDALGFGHGAL